MDQLHFSNPLWLWVGSAIPLVWLLYLLFYQTKRHHPRLEQFIDSHLLPYLLISHPSTKKSHWQKLLLWSLVWSCLTLAIAGPRWSMHEVEAFSSDQSLIIALDLSDSMNATDTKPSRLVRAKQKIEDILNGSKGVKIGIIAFAADAHIITPITDDKETIRHLLPSLETDLVYVQGSRLSPALEMAYNMFEAEAGNNKALLVMSDGGFEDSTAIMTAKKLAEKGTVIHTMGVGTTTGIQLDNKKNNSPIFTKLEKERLAEISKIGHGRYLEDHYSNQQESVILGELENRSTLLASHHHKKQLWDERFYLLIIPVLPILLWWWRRAALFLILFIFMTPTLDLHAADSFNDYFKNSEELGKQAFEEGDYEAAVQSFQDPYRRGIAYYKAKNFADAEKMFLQPPRPEVSVAATYNLGNALALQYKLEDAITAYEKVLAVDPSHTRARENLEIIKKMLEKNKQESSDSSGDSSDENSSDQQSQEQSTTSKDQEHQDPNSSQEQPSSSEQNSSQEHSSSTGQNSSQQQPPSPPQSSSQQPPPPSDQHSTQESSSPPDQNSTQESSFPKDQNSSQDPLQQPKNDGAADAQQSDEVNPQSATDNNRDQEPENGATPPPQSVNEAQDLNSQKDRDADLWLNQIQNDPKAFLKNKFYLESKTLGTREGIDPW